MDLSKVVDWFETHAKFVAAIVAAATIAVAVIVDDKHLDLADIVMIVTAFGGAGAVERIPNKKRG